MFVSGKLFKPSLMLADNPRSLTRVKHLRLARDKPCSLLQKFANYGCKKFYDIATCGQCYKTFLYDIYKFLKQARVLVPGKLFEHSLMFVGNPRSLTRVKHLRLAWDKHCSLLQKFANYGCKKFYNIVTRRKKIVEMKDPYFSIEFRGSESATKINRTKYLKSSLHRRF